MAAAPMSSREVLAAVERHLLQKGNADSYVFIREARSGAGFAGNAGQLDLLAIATWQSRGLERVGVEVKISRNDWQRELAKPSKAETFYPWCHRWYLAVPAPHDRIVRDDLPVGWGLLETSATGTKVIVPSPKNDAAVPPWHVMVGWLAQVDRRERAADQNATNAQIAAEVEKRKDDWIRDAARGLQRREERVAAANELLARLQTATGIDLTRTWQGDIDRLGQIWKHRDALGGLLDGGTVRRAIDALHALELATDALTTKAGT